MLSQSDRQSFVDEQMAKWYTFKLVKGVDEMDNEELEQDKAKDEHSKRH